MLEKLKDLSLPWPALPRIKLPAVMKPRLERLRALAVEQIRRLQESTAPARASAQAWYEKREPREKVLLRILGSVFAILLLYSLVYLPITSLRDSLADRISRRQQDLIEVRGMMRSYARLQSDLGAAQNRTVPGKDFSLFSVLEVALTKSVGREKIDSITPADHPVPGGLRQYTVEVKLSAISLAQVVDTLYGVQTLAVPVTVSSLQVRDHAQNPHAFDVEMTFMALGKSG
jgi:type II secretory pathway component PulM